MFKHADPNRRLPMYLQHGTVENLVWQLKLLPVVLVGGLLYDYIEKKRFEAAGRRRMQTIED